jgi:hypothetical protein
MADWIKMRSSLLTNPKVIRMSRVLLADEGFVAWLCPGACVTRDESVTKQQIPVVTRVVVGALLPTWSAVNDTAARDGIVRHASSRDIDDSAGVPGFGDALKAVGWLVDLPNESGVQFVNFEEHNQPQKERTLTAKTGAERQKEYRDRKKREGEADSGRNDKRDENRNDDGDVTGDVTGDGREEKKRVEKKNPSGSIATSAKSTKPKRGSKKVPDDFEVTADMVTWAAEKAPAVDWRAETEKFRDWEFQHARTDWEATWRTWMRNAQERTQGGGSGRSNSKPADWTAGAH